MIEIPRPQFDFIRPRLKVFGLGGAGCNAVDRLVLDGPSEADVIAINTDVQALTGSVARNKVQIGQTVTRGLGAGGDPEVGRNAAEEGVGDILGALTDATIVFLVVGLGGGTGSGAAPVIAELAREHNAMVVVFATLPFQFEGKRRFGQAMEALEALQPFADILICFENDKMSDLVSPKASIQEAFSVADATIGQSIRSLASMTLRRGPMHMGFDEVASVVRGENVRSLFGYGEASGDNRAHEALEAALGCPLLDRGRRLRETEKILVQIAGGPDLTLNEVQILMEEVQRYVPQEAQLFFGSAVDSSLTGRLAVNILTSIPAELPVEMAAPTPAPAPARRIRPATPPPAPVRAATPVAAVPAPTAAEEELELDLGVAETEEFEPAAEETDYAPEELASDVEAETEVDAEVEPEQESVVATAASQARPLFAPLRRDRPSAPSPGAAGAREPRAEQMQFEPANRGRFEKSEPTIIDGQDLDVPTFLRRGARAR